MQRAAAMLSIVATAGLLALPTAAGLCPITGVGAPCLAGGHSPGAGWDPPCRTRPPAPAPQS